MLVRLAMEFESTIEIVRGADRFDGKSILSILALGAQKGSVLELEVTGSDAEAAIEALAKLIQQDFSSSEATQVTEENN